MSRNSPREFELQVYDLHHWDFYRVDSDVRLGPREEVGDCVWRSIEENWVNEYPRVRVPTCLVGKQTLTVTCSIARYTVDSLLIPFKADQGPFPNRRTLRVQGGSKPYGELVADLENARGIKYSVEYRDPAEALKLMEEARQRGDEAGEMFWSIRTLPASGYGVADGVEKGKLDNGLFDFTPETPEETFQRYWGGQQ